MGCGVEVANMNQSGYEPSGEAKPENISAASPNEPLVESPSANTPRIARNSPGPFPGEIVIVDRPRVRKSDTIKWV